MVIQDDWRFKQYCKGDLFDITYLEWKYFSFTGDDVEGFFCYSIGNPNNKLGIKKCILSYAVYFEDDEKFGYIEVPKKECSLNKDDKWIFGDSFIKKIDDRSWQIKGKNKDVEINLKYTNIARGGEIRTDLGKSIFGRGWMDWVVFCNAAEVIGTIKTEGGGEIYDFKGLGYYDSNLGHWMPSNNLWTWGHGIKRVKDSVISFSIAETRGKKIENGRLYLSINDKTVLFSFDDYDLIYDQDKKLPQKYTIRAESPRHGYKLEITFNVEKTDVLRIRAFKIFPLIDLYMKRGRTRVKIHHPDEESYSFECKGAWEFPKNTLPF